MPPLFQSDSVRRGNRGRQSLPVLSSTTWSCCGGGGAAFPAEAWLGFAFALAAAVVWALYSVLAARLGDVPSEAVAGFCLASAAAAWLAHLAFEPAFALEARHWAVVALMGLGPTGAAVGMEA